LTTNFHKTIEFQNKKKMKKNKKDKEIWRLDCLKKKIKERKGENLLERH